MADRERRCRSIEVDGTGVIACGTTPTEGDIAAIREFQETLRTLRPRRETANPRTSPPDDPRR